MSYCELCGCQITGEVIPITVENVVMKVCRPCSKHGKPYVAEQKKKIKPKEIFTYSLPSVREDYSRIIKEGRERLGLTESELGSKISEDGSVIKLLEQSKFKPGEVLAKKLEVLLGISLFKEEVHE
jgi:putative transcription factor